jgi:hypothetical protein
MPTSCPKSLGITSKMPMSTFKHSALPLKRQARILSLGITSKMPMPTFYHSALPLKCWFYVRLLGVTSKTLMSHRSALFLLYQKNQFNIQKKATTSHRKGGSTTVLH